MHFMSGHFGKWHCCLCSSRYRGILSGITWKKYNLTWVVMSNNVCCHSRTHFLGKNHEWFFPENVFWQQKLLITPVHVRYSIYSFNSFHTDPAFSRENTNVVCLSEIRKFCQNYEWDLNETWMRDQSELHGIRQQLSSARSRCLSAQSVPRKAVGSV